MKRVWAVIIMREWSLLPPARATVQGVGSIPFLKFNIRFLAVKGFGVVGGGAVLFAASALAGSAFLPLLGELFISLINC